MSDAGLESGRCPFAATLLRKDFGCDHAIEVVRRGGPEVGCTDANARDRCEQLFGALKAAALPAFGHDDDLAATPHSVYVKIQFGGLLGVQRLLGHEAARVGNVSALAEEAERRFGAAASVPAVDVVPDITAWRARGRR